MPIAIYHFNVKVVSRSKGASAAAKAAYISGEKIKNEYDGVTHDYRKKGEVVHKEILLPNGAPPKYKNRTVLWNAVESAETRKNSQTAKHIDAALPVEITRDEQIDLVRNFCQQCFVSRGMCVDFAIHDKKDGNPHVHILLNTRRVDEHGFTTKDRSWNDKALLIEWRKLWADWCNHKLYYVNGGRIDHRSYKAQDIDKIPQVHLGAAACAIEKKGFKTDKGCRNRNILKQNIESEIEQLNFKLASINTESLSVRNELIETTVGCPISEMRMFIFEKDYMTAFQTALSKNGIPSILMGSGDGNVKILFNSCDDEKIDEMQSHFSLIGDTIPTINGKNVTWTERVAEYERRQLLVGQEKQLAPTLEPEKDKSVKKHRSR